MYKMLTLDLGNTPSRKFYLPPEICFVCHFLGERSCVPFLENKQTNKEVADLISLDQISVLTIIFNQELSVIDI